MPTFCPRCLTLRPTGGPSSACAGTPGRAVAIATLMGLSTAATGCGDKAVAPYGVAYTDTGMDVEADDDGS